MRARVHTVEAHRAIEVADLHRQKESQLAASLYVVSGFSRTTFVVSGFSRTTLDAIRRLARSARLAIDDAQFGRRHRRGGEVELTDGAEVLAERRPLEERVDDDGEAEIGDDQQGGRTRPRP